MSFQEALAKKRNSPELNLNCSTALIILPKCVVPKNIHTPPPTPQDFPFQGVFDNPPSRQEFPEFLNGDFAYHTVVWVLKNKES